MHALLDITLSNGIMAAALAVFALVIGIWLKRPALRHLLWLLVLLKFLTPPLFAVLTPKEAASEGSRIVTHEVQSAGESDRMHSIETLLAARESLMASISLYKLEAQTWAVMPNSFWVGAVSAVWLGGVVCFVGLASLRIFRFHRLLRFGASADPLLQHEADQLSSRLGLRHAPRVWLVPGRISPLLWGFGGGLQLVLPRELLVRLTPNQVSTLLAHELAHARRGDYWIRWLELAVIGWYWWHPAAWWVKLELQKAEEECCDAWVVWLFPESAKAYARALVQTVDFLDRQPCLPPAASGMGHLQNLKRRVSMIIRERRSPQLSWPLYLSAVAMGVVALGVTPPALTASTLYGDDDKVVAQKRADIESRLQAVERQLRDAMTALDQEKKARAQERGALERELNRAKEQLKAREKAKGEGDRKVDLEFKLDSKDLFKDKIKALHGAKGDAGWKAEFDIKFDSKDLEKLFGEHLKQHMKPDQVKKLEIDIKKKLGDALSPEKMKAIEKKALDAQREFYGDKVKALHGELAERYKKEGDRYKQELNTEKLQELQQKGRGSLEKLSEKVQNPDEIHKKVHEAVEKAMKAQHEQIRAIHERADVERKRAMELAEVARHREMEARQQAQRSEAATRAAVQDRTKAIAIERRAREDAVKKDSERKADAKDSKKGSNEELEARIQRLEHQIQMLTKALESKNKQ